MREPVHGEAELILTRTQNRGVWILEWPGCKQAGAFTAFTLDELWRFGLRDNLVSRRNTVTAPRVRVRVTIEELT